MQTLRVAVIALLALFGGSASPGGISAASFTVDSTVDAVDANPGDGVCATVDGGCTLRAAVQETNALAGPDTIMLPSRTYDLYIQGGGEDAAATGDLDITDDLEINGAGIEVTVVDGSHPGTGRFLLDTAFTVHPGATMLMSHLTIQHGGHEGSSGGGILNMGSLTVTDVLLLENLAFAGGGILNVGALTVERTALQDNEAIEGGGIRNVGGTLTARDSSFIHNGNPGGQSGGGAIESDHGGSIALNNVEFRDNFAFFGGAIFNGSPATLDNVTLENNSSSIGPGGGILNGDTMTLTNSTLSGNESSGIYNESDGTLTITNSTISANNAGILTLHTADITVLNSTISGNTRGGIFTDNGPLPNQTIFPTVTVMNSVVAGNGGADCADTTLTLSRRSLMVTT
jgi:CSLREA domain-containing protein